MILFRGDLSHSVVVIDLVKRLTALELNNSGAANHLSLATTNALTIVCALNDSHFALRHFTIVVVM